MGKCNSIATPSHLLYVRVYIYIYVKTLRIHIYIYGTKHIKVLSQALTVKISEIISFLAHSPHTRTYKMQSYLNVLIIQPEAICTCT